jgi:hypothetical protein
MDNLICMTPDIRGQTKAVLNMVRAQLLDGNIKNELLIQEIDEAEYKAWGRKK